MKVRHVPAALAHDPGDVARNGLRSARHGSIISDYAAEHQSDFHFPLGISAGVVRLLLIFTPSRQQSIGTTDLVGFR